ncbi:MAG: preprotein translocase subunit YajC [Bacteroidota bacterium]|jgi:preprotein translocase subunit YajC
MNPTIILLQAKGGGKDQFIMMMLVMAVLFFFMIYPQMKKQKKARLFTDELKKGDHIVTTGGIHGKITQDQEKFFVIALEEGSIKIEKSAVSMELTQAHYPKEK